MKIKIIMGCMAGGKRLSEGKTYESPKDLTDKAAVYLVNTGLAEEIGGEKKAAKPMDSKSGLKG